MNSKLLFLGLVACFQVLSVSAADLILLADQKSDYQIVLPDKQPTEALRECLVQTARLVQTAFLANGVEVAVVGESQRDTAKPALFLGDTAFTRSQGIEVTKLRDWSYVHRVVGRDIIVAGHDHPARGETVNPRRPNWDRVGTAKAVADFARQHLAQMDTQD